MKRYRKWMMSLLLAGMMIISGLSEAIVVTNAETVNGVSDKAVAVSDYLSGNGFILNLPGDDEEETPSSAEGENKSSETADDEAGETAVSVPDKGSLIADDNNGTVTETPETDLQNGGDDPEAKADEPADTSAAAEDSDTARMLGPVSANNITVTVYAPTDIIPENAELVVSPYDTEAAIKAIGNDAVSSAVAVDISFQAEGAPFIPEQDITVVIEAEALKSMLTPKLYHLNGDTAEEVTDITFNAESGTVEFKARDFSPYVVTELEKEGSVITSWYWDTDNESILESNKLVLTQPKRTGRKLMAAKPASYDLDYILSRLPQSITAVIDGEETSVPLTWTEGNPPYKKQADGTWPQTGTYVFIATFPEGIELPNGDRYIRVTVLLGDDAIVRPGLNVSLDYGTNNAVLTEEGIDLTVDRDTTFTINLDFGFPEGSTNKQVDISAAYGLSWNNSAFGQADKNCYFNLLSHAEHWYTELKPDGFITPMANKTMTIYDGYKCYDGTLTLKYEDSTDAMDVIDTNTNNKLHITTYGGYISTLGLNQIGGNSINDTALVFKLSYDISGQTISVVKKLNKITFSKPIVKTINSSSWETSKANLNKDNESQVSLNNPHSEYEAAFFVARATDASGSGQDAENSNIDKLFMLFEMPKDVQFNRVGGKSYPNQETEPIEITTYSTENTPTYNDAVQIITADEAITLPDGQEYTLSDPENNKLVLLYKGPRRGTTMDYRYKFEYQFTKPEANKLYTIQLVHSAIMFHNTEERWDIGTNVTSKSFRIIPEEEEVFVDVDYADKEHRKSGTNTGDWVWVSGVGAYGIGEDHVKQEFLLGGINIGNRGYGDSVPKTITYTYDTGNTNYCGITQQTLKYLNNGFKNLSVKLIDVTTSEITEQTITEDYIQSVISKGYIHRKDFTDDDNVYLKEISYQVDTINKRTANGRNNTENNKGDLQAFYGYVLTNDFKVNSSGQNHDYKVSVRIEDTEKDPEVHPAIEGISIAKLTNRYTVQSNNGTVTGDATMQVATKDNAAINVFTYGFDGKYNYTNLATYCDELYLISPYGDEFRNITITSGKDKTKVLTVTDDLLTVTKIADNPSLNITDEKYKNGIVYKIDLTKLTDEDDIYHFRQSGDAKLTGQEKNTDTYWNGTKVIGKVSFVTDIDAKDPVGTSMPLLYMRTHLPRTESGDDDISNVSFGTVYKVIRDTLNLTGNKNNVVFGGGTLVLKGTDNLLVNSSAKMSPEPEELYRTWNGNVDTYVGANNDINYRIRVVNTTNLDVPQLDVYVPVPKKDDKWNLPETSDTKFIQNESGEFEVNMELLGAGTSQQENFEIRYAVVENASSVSKEWAGYTWLTADEVEDWSKINFIHIISTAPVPQASEAVFDFTLRAYSDAEKPGEGYTEEDVNAHKKNIWAPYFQNTYGSAIVHGIGEPTATVLAPGMIAGNVWFDKNMNGYIEEKEDVYADHEVKLYKIHEDGKETLNQTLTTDKDGHYLFKGLLPGQNFKVVVEKPESTDEEEELIFTKLPYDYKTSELSMKFDNIDEENGVASVNADSTPDTTTDNSLFNLNLNCGITLDQPFADLLIKKKLNKWESSGEVTFVFDVTARKDEEVVYTNVVSMTFNNLGEQSYLIEQKIPTGSEVTVTEIYSGSGYVIDGDDHQTVTLTVVGEDEDPATVSFVNKYDSVSGKHGSGILNTFTKDGENWNWSDDLPKEER